MTNRRGWKLGFLLPCARFIDFLTQRLSSVCELTTAVYVPAARVSRVFCFEDIGPKYPSVMDFWVITGVKSA